jgi:hypothetical protein
MLGESSRSTYHIPKASTWLGSGFRAIAQSDMQVNVAVGSNVSGIGGSTLRIYFADTDAPYRIIARIANAFIAW